MKTVSPPGCRLVEYLDEGVPGRLLLVGHAAVRCRRRRSALDYCVASGLVCHAVNEMDLGVPLRTAAGKMDMEPPKVATELETFGYDQVSKVVVKKMQYLSLGT